MNPCFRDNFLMAEWQHKIKQEGIYRAEWVKISSSKNRDITFPNSFPRVLGYSPLPWKQTKVRLQRVMFT